MSQFISFEEVLSVVSEDYAQGRHNGAEVAQLVAEAVILTTISDGGFKKAGWLYRQSTEIAYEGVQNIINRNLSKGVEATMQAYVRHLNAKGIFIAE